MSCMCSMEQPIYPNYLRQKSFINFRVLNQAVKFLTLKYLFKHTIKKCSESMKNYHEIRRSGSTMKIFILAIQ